MLSLKLVLLTLLTSAVVISGTLSYWLGVRHARLWPARAFVAMQPYFCGVCSRVACARAHAGHSAEQRSLWRAFDTSVSAMQKDFQAALTLKAQASFAR